jgi:hypothetical protein
MLLVMPHLFLRFIGLSFVVPGVVAPALPGAFAVPAAFGDFGAGMQAVFAPLALARQRSWAIPAAWLFNIWGAADSRHRPVSRPACAHRSRNVGRGVLYSDGHRAAAACHDVTHGLIFGLLLREPSKLRVA